MGKYKDNDAGNSQPAVAAVAVTKSDTVSFAEGLCRGLYVGGFGDVAVVFDNGSAVTFVGVQAGTILPVIAKRVNSTGTTATNIVALY